MELEKLQNTETSAKLTVDVSENEDNDRLLIPSKSYEECNHSKKLVETLREPSEDSDISRTQTIPDSSSEKNSSELNVKIIAANGTIPKEQSKSGLEAETLSHCHELKDGFEAMIAQNSNVSEEQSTFFRTDPKHINSQLDVDDPSSEAAEVLASLPNLIPVSDPPIVSLHNSKVQDSCLNTCQESVIPQLKTEEQTGIPQLNPCQSSRANNEDQNLQEKAECKNCSTTIHSGPKGKNIENGVVGNESKLKEPVWCDVGIYKGTSCLVTSYYAPSSRDPDHPNVISDNLPDFNNSLKIDLEPGTAYKFRICAVNSCGRGPWSEVSAFRTSLPGYPGAPSSVSISRSVEGAHLSWQPPSNPAGNIIEYTVCLAVKNPSQAQGEHIGQKFTLMKVYNGPHTQTVVSNACLAEALIDTTSKPAIIFRIAAKNEKGFGPPTQVRWLQEIPDSKY